MSKLNNHYNIEENFFGRVYELPKKEIKPFNLIMDADEMIFEQVKSLK